jgi:DNA-binding transcriptional LysR family regulator
MQHADDVLAPLRRRSAAQIHVGMVSSAKYFLPRLMAQFREQHPEVKLQFTVGNRDHLVENLRRGEVDLAVMGAPPDEMASQAVPFAEQPLGIIAAPEHPLARVRAIAPSELSQHEFMLREPGSGTRAALERFIKDQQIELPLHRELTGNAAVKQAVMANLGLAFMSLHAAALELQGGLLVSLDVLGLPLLRRWYVVQAKTSPLSHHAQALRSFVVGSGACASVLALGVAAGAPAARQ